MHDTAVDDDLFIYICIYIHPYIHTHTYTYTILSQYPHTGLQYPYLEHLHVYIYTLTPPFGLIYLQMWFTNTHLYIHIHL
jgi:hypothetical protein